MHKVFLFLLSLVFGFSWFQIGLPSHSSSFHVPHSNNLIPGTCIGIPNSDILTDDPPLFVAFLFLYLFKNLFLILFVHENFVYDQFSYLATCLRNFISADGVLFRALLVNIMPEDSKLGLVLPKQLVFLQTHSRQLVILISQNSFTRTFVKPPLVIL